MAIPTITDFHEAMLLARARITIPDQELKQGSVEMVTVGLPGPYAMPGGRAIVYKYRTKSGNLKALRVFQVTIAPNMKQRYDTLGNYFEQHAKDFTAGFRYHDQGIRVKIAATDEQSIYPLIEMDWVEHVTLIKRIDELCMCGDTASLQDLLERWQTLVNKMRAVDMAHGDLCGDNVLVRPGGDLVLIDYDGVYIPSLKTMGRIVEGKPDYQHKDFQAGRPYDECMDAFSALLIYVVLSALQIQPTLWGRFTLRDNRNRLKNDNLLFKREDFINPDQSLVFKELSKLGDPRTDEALDQLRQYCRLPAASLAWPDSIFDPYQVQRKALEVLLNALPSDDDELILNAFNEALRTYPPAQPHLARVNLARRRWDAFTRLCKALKSKDDKAIVEAYDSEASILHGYQKLTSAQKSRIDQARDHLAFLKKQQKALSEFRIARHRGDERGMVSAWDLGQLSQCKDLFSEEREAYEKALRCVQMPDKVQAGIRKDDDAFIVAAYETDLARPWMGFTAADLDRIALAQSRDTALRNLRKALATDEDELIKRVWDSLLEGYSRLTPDEVNRVQLACDRSEALREFRKALFRGDERLIVKMYAPFFDEYEGIHPSEISSYELALRCVEMPDRVRKAIRDDDDDEILATFQPELERPWMDFSAQERKQIWWAKQRASALCEFRAALKTDLDSLIVGKYVESLKTYIKVQPDERKRAELAFRRVADLNHWRIALRTGQVERIVSDYDEILDGHKEVLPHEWQQLEAARKCVAMVAAVRDVIRNDDDVAIDQAYDERFLHPTLKFNAAEQARIRTARSNATFLRVLRGAFAADKDDEILRTHQMLPATMHRFLTSEDRKRIDLAVQRRDALKQLRKALVSGDIQKIVQDYDPILDNHPEVLASERQQYEIARRCLDMMDKVRAAITQDDDEAILRTYDARYEHPRLGFKPKETERIQLALKRVPALHALQEAIADDDDNRIVDAYIPELSGCTKFTAKYKDRLELARSRRAALTIWRQALLEDRDQDIVDCYDPVLDDSSAVHPYERERLAQARARMATISVLSSSIALDDDDAIEAAAAGKAADHLAVLSSADRNRVELARARVLAHRRLERAFESGNDDWILAAYDPVLEGYSRFDLQVRDRLNLARQRLDALKRFRQALSSGDERRIADDYDPILDQCSAVLPVERKLLEEAQRRVEMPGLVRQALASGSDEAIVKAYNPQLVCAFTDFTVEEHLRIELAVERQNALQRVRLALQTGDERQIVAQYDPILDSYEGLSKRERERINLAHLCLAMPGKVRQAIDAGDVEEIAAVFDETLLRPFSRFSPAELDRCQSAQRYVNARGQILAALKRGDVRAALDIEQMAGILVADAKYSAAKADFLTTQDVKHVHAEIDDGYLVVHWTWPSDLHIQYACVAWHTEHYPEDLTALGVQARMVSRSEYDNNHCFRYPAVKVRQLWITVFSALRDGGAGQDERWLYSPASDMTSKTTATTRPDVTCQLLTDPETGIHSLVLQTADSQPLPNLLIVKKSGGMPWSPNDGEVVQKLTECASKGIDTVQLPVPTTEWFPGTVIRVFGAPDTTNWYPITSGMSVN